MIFADRLTDNPEFLALDEFNGHLVYIYNANFIPRKRMIVKCLRCEEEYEKEHASGDALEALYYVSEFSKECNCYNDMDICTELKNIAKSYDEKIKKLNEEEREESDFKLSEEQANVRKLRNGLEMGRIPTY